MLDVQLTPKQYNAFTTKAREILYGGAAGGGKSFLNKVSMISYALAIPNLCIFLFRKTYPQLKRNYLIGPSSLHAMLKPYEEQGLVKWNSMEKEFKFANGSSITLNYLNNDADLENYQGAEIHFLIIDEATHFTDHQVKYLRGRVRLVGVKIPKDYEGMFPRILYTTNPGSVGHAFFKREFVDPHPPNTLWKASDKDGGFTRIFIPALLQDNPFLLKEDPNYINNLRSLGKPHLVKALLEGSWDIALGGAFDDVWDRDKHIVKPFEIPHSWHVSRCYDHGSSKPYAIIWTARSDGSDYIDDMGKRRSSIPGDLFCIAEQYPDDEPNVGNKATTSEICILLKEKEEWLTYTYNIRHIHPGPADNAIFDNFDGYSLADKFKSHGVLWKKSNKSAGSRVAGLENMRGMFKAALQEPHEESALYFFETCRNLIRTIPVLPRDDKKPDDVDTKAEDHLYDALRYRIGLKQKQLTISKLTI